MNHKEHNGWYNYETWAIALWIDNDEMEQAAWHELARSALMGAEESTYSTQEEVAARDLADALKERHEEELPDLKGFAADLLNAAMSEVNWREIAEHLIETVKAEAQT